MAIPLLFSGFAQLHLQGAGALAPFKWTNRDEVIYFIGSPVSQYKIIDQRWDVNLMAIDSINARGIGWLPQQFCTPCFVEITEEPKGLSILLKNSVEKLPEFPLIWLGTMDGKELEANPVIWLRYMNIEDGRAAFVGVVAPALSPYSEENFIQVEN